MTAGTPEHRIQVHFLAEDPMLYTKRVKHAHDDRAKAELKLVSLSCSCVYFEFVFEKQIAVIERSTVQASMS